MASMSVRNKLKDFVSVLEDYCHASHLLLYMYSEVIMQLQRTYLGKYRMGQCMDKTILAGGIFVLVAKCVRQMFGGLAHCGSSSSITKILILAFCVISAYTSLSWRAESQQYVVDGMQLQKSI